MRWPWQKIDFASTAVKLSYQNIHAMVSNHFPLAGSGIVQLGDWPLYALRKKESDEMWWGLPSLPFDYEEDFFDCENQTRRRMTQIVDFQNAWTNLRKPLAILEIRGFVPMETSSGMEGQVGHSMLYEILSDGTGRLVEPASLQFKEVGFVKEPWLIYQ
jgi:hypothetical protein